MRPKFFALTLITSFSMHSVVSAADLLQVYQLALVNDPIYTSARYALAAGHEKEKQGLAVLLPTVGLGGTYARSDKNFGSVNNSYSLQLTQPLLRPGNWEIYQKGRLSLAASEIEFAQAQQDLMLRTSVAYFDVLGAQDALSFLGAQKISISEQRASAKRKFEIGASTITDVNEAQARYDLAITQEIAAQSDLDLALFKLQRITGQPLIPLAVLRKDVKLSHPFPSQIDTWVASAQADNYAVMARQVKLKIAQSEIKHARAEYAPTVDLTATRTYIDQANVHATGWQQRGYSNAVSVRWSIPLFSGLSTTSKVNEAVALADKARSELEDARRTAILNARQSFLGVTNGLMQVKAFEAAELSSQFALDSCKLGYQFGVRINMDVLNAQQQLYSIRRDLARARYDTLLNGLKLKAATGSLHEDDLAQVNALLTASAL